MDALIIARRELRDAIRDWRIVAPMIILALAFPYVMQASTLAAGQMVHDVGVITRDLVPLSLILVGFFPASISLVIALESFVGESERNSLEPLLASPVSDTSLYTGKLLGSLLLPLASSYVGMGTYLVTLFISGRGVGVAPELLIVIVLLTAAEGMGMIAGATILSSHAASVRAANLLAFFVILPVLFLVQGEALLIFWKSGDALWHVLAGVIVVDLLLLRMGYSTFNRQAILERETDELNPARLLRFFWRRLAGEAGFSLRRIYVTDLPALFGSNLLPFLVTMLVSFGAIGVGAYLAVRFPLPAELFAPARVHVAPEASIVGSQFVPGLDTFAIFAHNVRTLALSTVLGVFSFGLAPLLVLATPSALIGFFSAEIAQGGSNPILFLATFILPHGILEIPAAVLATTFALRLGASLTGPSEGRPAGERFMDALADWVKVLVFVVVPLLLVAAFVESTLTPRIVAFFYGG